jgi:predicted nucleic acid-binding protein
VEALSFINQGTASPTPTRRWKEFNAAIWDRASSLWSALRAGRRSHNDADVLIAAHALHYGAVIVSANLEHFQGPGASVENWDEPLVKS